MSAHPTTIGFGTQSRRSIICSIAGIASGLRVTRPQLQRPQSLVNETIHFRADVQDALSWLSQRGAAGPGNAGRCATNRSQDLPSGS